ncbi:MAG TPA: SDR family NAD(P)-dependent oxidoreductase [Tepidisphaeraceae bacterium]|jgi:NAD(P)-dependent dehydrogenase (short-subunit alcohol dehydrogenase family)|nr:SDR family NAD(P)-dependent oxidoreductase [Tepidisphaeraceae bacterium]
MAMLQDKVAFITGAASGIGKATALRFAREGANIALLDTAEQGNAAEKVVEQIEKLGRDAIYLPCDVSRAPEVEQAVAAAVRAFGGLHIVFANAGVNGVWTPIEELKPAEWDKTLNINLKGTYLTIHYAIPHLRKAGGGSIIITSSVNGTRTFSTAGAAAYSTSKAGQIAFMKMAALELARYGIRVNAICPGAIDTHIGDRTTRRHTEKVEVKVEFPDGPAGIDEGQGEPSEVADTCLFLACELSRHVSGVEIFVDGGASLLK